MQVAEKDIEIMSTIYNLRFMTTQQIHSIHGYSGKYGSDVTRSKLKQLEEKGYLKSYRPNVYEPKIFYLSKKGAEEVALYNGFQETKTYQRSDKSTHQVMISEGYVTLRQANIGRLRRFILSQQVGVAYADALIEYRMGDKSKLIFLEADRSTERIGVIIDKLNQYADMYQTNEWKEKYGVFTEVAFVTVSDTRKRSLLRLKEQYPIRIRVVTLEEFTATPAVLVY